MRRKNVLETRTNKLALLCVLTLTAMGSSVSATPIVDGRFDPAEGYTTGYWVDFQVEKSDMLVEAGELWSFEEPISGDVVVSFSQPLTLVDNTYGANSIGWGSSAPSGKNHNFKDLLGSDNARFQFTDASGAVVFDFVLDYISETSKGSRDYQSLGVTGGDGEVHTGSASSLLAYGTSLDYNFNTRGYVLTNDSPHTDEDYTDNPSYPGWIFEVLYEVRVDGSLFKANGFGAVTVPLVHDSPNKIGKNKVYPRITDPIPEPVTVLLLGLGSLVLLLRGPKS